MDELDGTNCSNEDQRMKFRRALKNKMFLKKKEYMASFMSVSLKRDFVSKWLECVQSAAAVYRWTRARVGLSLFPPIMSKLGVNDMEVISL